VTPGRRRDATITLPKAIDEALEDLMLRDRAWFDTHPDQRVRRRLVEGCELRSNAFARLAAGEKPLPESREVLVVRAPSTSGVRFRVFLPLDPRIHGLYEHDVNALSAAATDEDFMLLLRQQLLAFGPAVKG
jgi:hypothetical protein